MFYQFYAVQLVNFGVRTLLPNIHANKGRALAYAQDKKRLLEADSYELVLLTLSDPGNVPGLSMIETIVDTIKKELQEKDIIEGEFTDVSLDTSAEGEWR